MRLTCDAGKQISYFYAPTIALFAFASLLDFYFDSAHSNFIINILDENVKNREMTDCYYSWSCWHFPRGRMTVTAASPCKESAWNQYWGWGRRASIFRSSFVVPRSTEPKKKVTLRSGFVCEPPLRATKPWGDHKANCAFLTSQLPSLCIRGMADTTKCRENGFCLPVVCKHSGLNEAVPNSRLLWRLSIPRVVPAQLHKTASRELFYEEKVDN